jgi:hypothetical protein
MIIFLRWVCTCTQTGTTERDWLSKGRSAQTVRCSDPVDGEVKWGTHLTLENLRTSESWDAGAFRQWPLGELESMAITPAAADAPGPRRCVFEIHIRTDNESLPQVEVSHLQALAPPGAMFQVASNFNCLELPSWKRPINDGSYATDLMFDSTQGPAAASGAGVSAIAQAHLAFHKEGTMPSEWGQHEHQQVELLGSPVLRVRFTMPCRGGSVVMECMSGCSLMFLLS